MLANFDEDFQSYDPDREYHRAMETEDIDWEEFAKEISDPDIFDFPVSLYDIENEEDIPF